MKHTAFLTPEGVVKWVMHRHDYIEVMCYIKGKGALKTPTAEYPFDESTLIVVPPGVMHGSCAEKGSTFRNISVSFDKAYAALTVFDKVTVINDVSGDGHALADMLYRSIGSDPTDGGAFSSAVAAAYAAYLVRGQNRGSGVDEAVDKIAEKILFSFSDTDFKVSELLTDSGYAVDYIREKFKRRIGQTPTEYTNCKRIEHAARLIEIYGGTLSVSRLAELSGFSDAEYFSRLFVRKYGVTPKKYSRPV